MTVEVKILYADTNAFLQVRDLKDIPWRDMFEGVKAVDVMVAPRVIEELDKHKASTNQRRRDRARAALLLIDEASRNTDFSTLIRTEPVRVRIVISATPRFNWASHSILDPAKPDDQLVAEALSFGNGAAVFSHDSGPRIRARIAGLESFEPLSEWMLPVEQTDEQRKVTSLERELKRALRSSPTIIAGFNNYDEVNSEVRIIVPVLQPLEPEQIERRSIEYLAKHPRKSLAVASGNRLVYQLGGISEAQVVRYQEEYLSFETAVRAHYANLHKQVGYLGSTAAVSYFVENDSSVSAKGLRIEFDLEGDGSLLADRQYGLQTSRKGLKMPEPPEPPGSILDGMRRYSHAPAGPILPTLRDPVGFYWFDRPKLGDTHSALQCEDFRATRKYCDTMFVMPLGNLPTTTRLHLHVSAENLPAPISILAKLHIVEQAADWSDEVVQEILGGDQE